MTAYPNVEAASVGVFDQVSDELLRGVFPCELLATLKIAEDETCTLTFVRTKPHHDPHELRVIVEDEDGPERYTVDCRRRIEGGYA